MAAMAIEMEVAKTVTDQALSWPDRARGLKITDQPSLERAAEELLAIKGLRDQVEQTFGPIVRKAYETHREAVAQRKKVDAPLDEAEQILKHEIALYQIEQARLRREEQARIDAERERIAAEELEREIERAEAEGASKVEVAAIIQRGPQPQAPVVVRPVPTTAPGISMRETWSAEVTDLAALVRFVAANPQYINLVAPNMTALNGLARSMKGAMKFPGVRVVAGSSVAARRF